MKKIEVSSVKMESNVQVLFINASLVKKALCAQMAATRLIERMKASGDITPRYEEVPNEEVTADLVNEEPERKYVPMLDENGNQIIDYSWSQIDAEYVKELNEVVEPFLKELTDAFDE